MNYQLVTQTPTGLQLNAAIILADAPTCAAAFAAQELQHHFEKLTNEVMPVYAESALTHPNNELACVGPSCVKIWVGESEGARKAICAAAHKAKKHATIPVNPDAPNLDYLRILGHHHEELNVSPDALAEMLIERLSSLAEQEYAILCPDDLNLILWGRDDPDGDNPLALVPPWARVADSPEYKAFPAREEDAQLRQKRCCRFAGTNVINVPTRGLFSDEHGAFEAWVKLDASPVGSMASGEPGFVLSVEEPDTWSSHRVMATRNGIPGSPAYTLEYVVTNQPPGDIEYTARCAVPNIPAGKWTYLLATYEFEAASSKTRTHLFVANDQLGQHDDNELKGKTNCHHQWVGVGSRQWCSTLGHLRTPKAAPAGSVDPWLDQHGIVSASARTTGFDKHSRPFSGAIAGIRILNQTRHELNPDELQDLFLFRGLFAPLDPDQVVVELDFREPIGSRHVIDRTRGSRIFAPPPDIWDQRGTLDAAYDFLEDSIGVRWFAPMELGECFMKPVTKLSAGVEAQSDIRRPFMHMTRDIHDNLALANPDVLQVDTPSQVKLPSHDEHLWKIRMRMGGTTPSYGKMVDPSQKCLSDSKTVECYENSAKGYLETMSQTHFSYSARIPNHGANVYSLVLEDIPIPNSINGCAMISGQGWEKHGFFSNRYSDYLFSFTSAVAERLASSGTQILPDKVPLKVTTWIGQQAYMDHALPPQCEIGPNVIVRLALGVREWPWWPAEDLHARDDILMGWRSKRPPPTMISWLYLDRPAYNDLYQEKKASCRIHYPGFFGKCVGPIMHRLVDNAIRGVISEHSSASNGTYFLDQLELYLVYKLAHWIQPSDVSHADKISQKVQDLTDEFFSVNGYYGAGGPHMRAFYEAIQYVYTDTKKYPADLRLDCIRDHCTLRESEDTVDPAPWSDYIPPRRNIAELHYGRLLQNGNEGKKQLQDCIVNAAYFTVAEPEAHLRVTLFKEAVWDFMCACMCRVKANPLLVSAIATIGDDDRPSVAGAIALDGSVHVSQQVASSDRWTEWKRVGTSADRAKSIALAQLPGGKLQIHAIGMDDGIYFAEPETGWARVGQSNDRAKQIAVALNQDGRMEVFAVGMDDRIYHAWQSGQPLTWSGWHTLSQAADRFKSIVVTEKAGGLHLFAVGTDDGIYHASQTKSGTVWSSWERIGGIGDCAQNLAVGNRTDGTLEVFVVGADDCVYHSLQDQSSGGWTHWERLGGVGDKAKRLAWGRNADDIELFAVFLDDKVHRCRQDQGGWSPWKPVEWTKWQYPTVIDLACHSLKCGLGRKLAVVAVGTDDAIWHSWQQACGTLPDREYGNWVLFNSAQ